MGHAEEGVVVDRHIKFWPDHGSSTAAARAELSRLFTPDTLQGDKTTGEQGCDSDETRGDGLLTTISSGDAVAAQAGESRGFGPEHSRRL